MSKIVKLYRTNYSRAVHSLMMLMNHRTNRHIVVFESDDWGSIRMPSLDVLDRLIKRGVPATPIGLAYDRVDTLASNDDLELLMEVLSSVQDSQGNPAIITLNCVTANPYFEAIRANGFQMYCYEPFTETLKRYPHHDKAFGLWKEGIAHKVFQPQFHGREHLNVSYWMRFLQSGNKDVMACFDEGTFSLGTFDNNSISHVLEAFDMRLPQDRTVITQSIKEGLSMFEQIFGFKSDTMIAPCYTWDSFVEDIAAENGVIGIQGGYIQKHSYLEKSKGNRITGHYWGEKNKNGQIYTVRNCNFEPSQGKNLGLDCCLAGISKAFSMMLPAVISCHRLNFVGELDASNRDQNLRDFKRLLKTIVTKYPDVEFMSSDEFVKNYK